MKFFALILYLSFLLTLQCVYGALWDFTDKISKSDVQTVKDAVQGIENTVTVNCVKKAGITALRKYVMAREDLLQCIKDTGVGDTEFPSEFCTDKKGKINQCLKTAANEVATTCFREDNKWVIDEFLLKYLDSLMEYFCKDMFTVLKEMMNLQGLDCIVNIMKSEQVITDGATACVSRMEKASFTSRTELCNQVDLYKSCAVDIARQVCRTNDGFAHILEENIDLLKNACLPSSSSPSSNSISDEDF